MSPEARALAWIVDLLRRLEVPFQVVGGLAARAYGATRSLVDLDFYVPTDRLNEIAAAAPAHVVRPPSKHGDDDWDIVFMAFEHEDVRIELGGADGARYFDRAARRWTAVEIDFAGGEHREVLGIGVPLMPLDDLIAYKRALDRPVDREDLVEIDDGGSDGPDSGRAA